MTAAIIEYIYCTHIACKRSRKFIPPMEFAFPKRVICSERKEERSFSVLHVVANGCITIWHFATCMHFNVHVQLFTSSMTIYGLVDVTETNSDANKFKLMLGLVKAFFVRFKMHARGKMPNCNATIGNYM